MGQKSIKFTARFLGLHKSSSPADRAMSAIWHGQKAHIGIKPNPQDQLSERPRQQHRAHSICVHVLARSIAGGFRKSKVTWEMTPPSAGLNSTQFGSFWEKTSTVSWTSEAIGAFAARTLESLLLPDCPHDRPHQEVTP